MQQPALFNRIPLFKFQVPTNTILSTFWINQIKTSRPHLQKDVIIHVSKTFQTPIKKPFSEFWDFNIIQEPLQRKMGIGNWPMMWWLWGVMTPSERSIEKALGGWELESMDWKTNLSGNSCSCSCFQTMNRDPPLFSSIHTVQKEREEFLQAEQNCFAQTDRIYKSVTVVKWQTVIKPQSSCPN